ncbi:alcohol dehydrogenase, zinc-binding protein [Agrilactobacillus composti DSM 18527 = JCM 14202]|uniref:Zinc-type alcohol dehydrogenase-like protein n=2 Tax=Agrilactobacillus TaxID=2767875 RepID=A0A0R1Y245_9LACO|nr:alcohol dehydrogenase, zinc-binding protein [Agrilactobacillus composti DSM 18527 = JCM 14202]
MEGVRGKLKMTKYMEAIGFTKHLPISQADSLVAFELPMPSPEAHDLLVQVTGISVNPVDVGVRQSGSAVLAQPKVIGWDAVGTVVKTGADVTLFQPGDRVFYAGSFKRPGSNSAYQLVDERIVGHAPQKLSDAQAAAIPLTALTAWEGLFEQLEIDPTAKKRNEQKTILIINGSGGVGSMATQLAHWAGLKVIASASRPETIQWVKAHGADQTVNHRHDLVQEVKKLGYSYVDYIFELNNLDAHWTEMARLIKPGGRIASITENRKLVDLKQLTKKRAKFAWEWMFSKSYFQTEDMQSQHDILEKVAHLLDSGQLVTTMTQTFSPINVANLKKAHAIVESNHEIGKVTLTN